MNPDNTAAEYDVPMPHADNHEMQPESDGYSHYCAICGYEA